MPQAKHCHLPDLLYGGIGQVADMMDERGAEATVSELSCAIVNVCRVAHQHEKALAKLADRVGAIDKHVESLLGIAMQQSKCNDSSSNVVTAVETALRASLAIANDRITDLETRIAKLEPAMELVKRIEALERVVIVAGLR